MNAHAQIQYPQPTSTDETAGQMDIASVRPRELNVTEPLLFPQ